MRRTLIFAVLAACGGASPPPAPPPTNTENNADGGVASAAQAGAAPSSSGSVVSPPMIADAGAPAPGAPTSAAPAPTSAAPAAPSAGGPDQATLVCGGAAMPFEQKVRPEIKRCFFEAKVKNPALSGKVKIVLNVGAGGKLGAVNVVDEKELGKEAVRCMTDAVKAAKPDVSQCKDKRVEMVMAFGAAAK